MSDAQSCYRCGAPKESDEHCPPKAVFGSKKNSGHLLVIPSCTEHNEKFSMDDEFFRNQIALLESPSSSAHLEAWKTTKRAIDRSGGVLPSLFLSEGKRVNTTEGEIVEVQADRERLVGCIEKIAAGLAFHHLGRPISYRFEAYHPHFVNVSTIRDSAGKRIVTRPHAEIVHHGSRLLEKTGAPKLGVFPSRFYYRGVCVGYSHVFLELTFYETTRFTVLPDSLASQLAIAPSSPVSRLECDCRACCIDEIEKEYLADEEARRREFVQVRKEFVEILNGAAK